MQEKYEKPKVVVIVGPTASGKTGLSIEIARRFNGEVISADSRQVYKGLDIGTAKVTSEETQGVPHHLIDIADPMEVYTAAYFKRDARKAIADIVSRDKLPIIAGGTFFYVDTLLGKISLPEVPPNEGLRKELEKLSVEELSEQLNQLDPTRYSTVNRTNKRRLIRAIEVATALGQVPKTEAIETPYDVLTIGLEIDKETLRARYEERAKTWLEQGLKTEVKNLLASGVTRDRLQEMGFEYQLVLNLLDEKIDEIKYLEMFIQKNWQYAKRQLTWLKRDKDIRWFKKDESEVFAVIEGFLK